MPMDPFRSNAGMSLISVLMAVAVLGIVGVIATTMLQNQIAGQKHVEQRQEVVELQRLLTESLSCQKTMPKKPCSGKWLSMKNHTGGILIKSGSKTGVRWGSIDVRARCRNDKLVVEWARMFRKPPNPNAFVKDPLTGKKLSWQKVGENPYCDSAGGGGGGNTPFGKCQYQTRYMHRNAVPMATPSMGIRKKVISCPTDYPTIVSATTYTPCHGLSAEAYMAYPSQVSFSAVYLWDRTDIDSAAKNANAADCQARFGSPTHNETYLSYMCCQL